MSGSKRYSLRSGQWQKYFCSSFVGSVCRFWQILLSRLNTVLAFSLLHSSGFSHTSQTDISPLQSIIRLRHHYSSCTVCLRAQYWGPFSSSCTLRLSPSSSLSFFVFLETFYRFPPWFDYSWLSQRPLLWFCQEPWIHFWLKTVHKEACHKNLPNCLFRA